MRQPPVQQTTSGPSPSGAEPWSETDGAQAEILALVEPLRRFVASRVDSAGQVDDIVQETLTRVLGARERLEDGTLTAYAFTVARNLIAAGHREQTLARRHAPRVLDLREPDRPDEVLLAREERVALAAALAGLPAEHREQLTSHVLHEEPLHEVAARSGQDPPALAARLGRTRARLRLDYVLALRRVDLPTARCRPVLLAVSAGDRRRQTALRAGDHLLACRTCGELSEPLLERTRALAGFVPLVPLGALHGRLTRRLQQNPVSSALGGVAAAAAATAVAAVLLVHGRADPAPVAPTVVAAPASPRAGAASPAPASLRTASGPVLPRAGGLAELAGQRVLADGVRVLAVPADEGFWVGEGPAERVWVQLDAGRESSARIRVGQKLDFSGTVVANPGGFARMVGLSGPEGADELTRAGAHLRVAAAAVRIRS